MNGLFKRQNLQNSKQKQLLAINQPKRDSAKIREISVTSTPKTLIYIVIETEQIGATR